MTTPSLKKLWMLTITKQTDEVFLTMFDDPAFFNSEVRRWSNYELAQLYQEWMNDNRPDEFGLEFSLNEECHKRDITFADLEALLVPSQYD